MLWHKETVYHWLTELSSQQVVPIIISLSSNSLLVSSPGSFDPQIYFVVFRAALETACSLPQRSSELLMAADNSELMVKYNVIWFFDAQFSVSLLTISHSETSRSSVMINFSNISKFLWTNRRCSIIGKDWKNCNLFEDLWISLMKIRNKRGPKTDPWGTPQRFSSLGEEFSPIWIA